MTLTRTMLEVLRRAALRPHGHVCPTFRLRGCAQDLVLDALRRRGLIEGSPAPIITAAGRAQVQS